MKIPYSIAFHITIIYLIIGALWILFSDMLSMSVADESLTLYSFFQRYKGWFFILVTAISLYFLLDRWTRRIMVSQQKLQQKERELKISNEHYRSLFNHNPDAVFELSREGYLLAINPRGAAAIGEASTLWIGKRLDTLLSPEEVDRAKRHFEMALTGQPRQFETTIVNAKDDERIVRCSLIPSIINEEVVGVFGIARDITLHRREEEMMMLSEKMSVIGHLAAAVAHEIRNPLTSLKGFIQLMKSSKVVNEEHMNIMLEEVDRINLISGELLILGKKQDVEMKIENVWDILQQVKLLMDAEANMNNISIHLKNETSEPAIVFGNASQLKQVFINLIKNSLEATTPGDNVSITLTKQDEHVHITVTDHGIGIGEERLLSLGEPFYSTKERGSGLGLAVCYRIVERLKGTIHFESQVGEGTTVHVELPSV